MRANSISPPLVIAIGASLAAVLPTCPSVAAGALAVGAPADVARQGFASGTVTNASDFESARKKAIDACRESIDASEAAKRLCKVVATFNNQCFAIAIDPKAGTPGVGWAIAESLRMADKQAIEQCRGTAGATRVDFCVIFRPDVDHGCDGDAR